LPEVAGLNGMNADDDDDDDAGKVILERDEKADDC
jgi:hypothetical protein